MVITKQQEAALLLFASLIMGIFSTLSTLLAIPSHRSKPGFIELWMMRTTDGIAPNELRAIERVSR